MARLRGGRTALAVCTALAATWVAVALPPAPVDLAPAPDQPRLWRGAYHVHSTRSDGSGTPDQIAAAAARAGLEFVVLTDHGDATRAPEPPRYQSGVLLIDAVEISTDDGHYVALGLPQSPYPLAGEGRAVADDVARLGGVGILAHPDSPRRALAWQDWSVRADGFEWINGDSAWRGASAGTVATSLPLYPFRPSAVLTGMVTYPEDLFSRLDVPNRPPQLALAAVDAHARVGWRRDAEPLEGGRTLARVPSYEASFGTFGIVVPWKDAGATGRAAGDAGAVLAAIREGRVYSAIFGMARVPWLSLEIEPTPAGGPRPLRQATAGQAGERALPSAPGVSAEASAASRLPIPDLSADASAKADSRFPVLRVRSNGPPGSLIRLRQNGRPWMEVQPGADRLLTPSEPDAVYRAELWLEARRGWPAVPVALTAARVPSPSTIRDPRSAPTSQNSGSLPPVAGSLHRVAITPVGWHVEHDARSSAETRSSPGPPSPVEPGAAPVVARARLSLADGGRTSQFAALVADLPSPMPAWDVLSLEVSASAPSRLSVQLREPGPGDGLRWRHSMYVDAAPRRVLLPASEFRAIRPAAGRVPLSQLHALLLVLDTVNAQPGASREVTVHKMEWLADR